MDDWDEKRYKRTRAHRVFPSITVFIEHTCAVGNCKHERIPCRQLSLDKVFVDYITLLQDMRIMSQFK